MNKLLINTNIVIDLLVKRMPFYNGTAKLFSLADKNKVKLAVSSLTFANTNYVLSKLKSTKDTREILRKFKILVRILPINEKIIELSLNDESFNDLEDRLQYYTGLENDQEIIITRNQNDFKSSKIPVMTVEQYLVSSS